MKKKLEYSGGIFVKCGFLGDVTFWFYDDPQEQITDPDLISKIKIACSEFSLQTETNVNKIINISTEPKKETFTITNIESVITGIGEDYLGIDGYITNGYGVVVSSHKIIKYVCVAFLDGECRYSYYEKQNNAQKEIVDEKFIQLVEEALINNQKQSK